MVRRYIQLSGQQQAGRWDRKAKGATIRDKMAADEVVCFVIGPIGDRLAPIGSDSRLSFETSIQTWEMVIKPACNALGIDPVRADQLAQPGEITEQIFRHLRDDFLVIADVTDANPNVMYELGLRHACGRLSIQIGEVGKLPFDIAAIRTIRFNRTELGLIEARDHLIAAIKAGLQNGQDQLTATRVFLGQSPTSAPGRSAPIAMPDLDDKPGFLDVLAAAEEAFPLLAQDMKSATEIIVNIDRLTREITIEIDQLNRNGGSSGARLLAANRYAAGLVPHVESLEELAGLYSEHAHTIVPAINYLLDRIEEDPSQLQAQEILDFLNTVVALAPIAKENALVLTSYAQQTEAFGKITRLLREPGERLARAARRFSELQPDSERWAARVAALRPTS